MKSRAQVACARTLVAWATPKPSVVSSPAASATSNRMPNNFPACQSDARSPVVDAIASGRFVEENGSERRGADTAAAGASAMLISIGTRTTT